MEERLLRLGAVMEMTGFKRSKIYALVADGRFPAPIKCDGCSVWPKSRVASWIEAQIAAADRHAA